VGGINVRWHRCLIHTLAFRGGTIWFEYETAALSIQLQKDRTIQYITIRDTGYIIMQIYL